MTLPDLWRDVGARVGFFTKETRNQIPDAPGCYAWFIPLWLYVEDLDEFLDLMGSFLVYDPNSVSSEREVAANFNWDSIAVKIRKIASVVDNVAKSNDWERVLADPCLKTAFQRALMEATILMPPLYVGKTDNLRVRYMQHVEGAAPGANVFHNRFNEFARTLGLPLVVSDLLFVCVQTAWDTERVLREAKLNELLEYVLKLLCKPPFSLR